MAVRRTATLWRSAGGISYRIKTTNLNPRHAYTVWLIVINNPSACTVNPCPAAEFLSSPDTRSQVVFGQAGLVAPNNGKAAFKATVPTGPLPGGWLGDQGLDDPLGAEIHFTLNDHGPRIRELMPEMIETYRAGCRDDSPFPAIFPPVAIADGTPGPNTCLLYQFVAFQ